MKWRHQRTWWVLLWIIAAASTVRPAQDERSVWDGVYTEAQAARGAALFENQCAQCHGPAGAGGGMAPPVLGPAFAANYDGQTVGDLFDRNRTTMPPGKEGTLSGRDNADITAYILKVNGFPPGATELPSLGMALKTIQYVAFKP